MSFKQKKFYQKFNLSKAFSVPPLKLSSPGDLLQTVSWLDKIFSMLVHGKNMNSRIGMLVHVDISTQTPKTARKSDDS